MPSIIDQLRTKGQNEGLSDTEAAFFRTNEINTNLRSEVGVTDEEKAEFESAFGSFDQNIKKFGPLIDVIGTEQESKIPEVLGAEPSLIGQFGESLGLGGNAQEGAFQQELRSNIEPPVEVARSNALLEGISPMLKEGRSVGNFIKALQESPPSLEGGLQFDQVISNFKRLQGESELDSEKLAKRFPEVNAESEAAGKMLGDLGVGVGAAFLTTRGVGAIPGIAGAATKMGPLTRAGEIGRSAASAAPSVIGSGVGTAVEGLSSSETNEDIIKNGLSGSAFDLAFRQLGPLARKTGATKFVKGVVQKVRTQMLDTAFNSVYKAIEPNQMGFRRGIERGADDPATIGRVFFEENITPDIPFLFLDKSMPVRLEKRINQVGSNLGAVRDEADAVSQNMIKKIRTDFDSSGLSPDELMKRQELIGSINDNYQVSADKLVRKIRENVVNSDNNLTPAQVDELLQSDIAVDAYIKRTPLGRAQSVLLEIAKDIELDPRSHLTINTAVQKMQPFRKTVRQKGAPVDAVDLQVAKTMEGIFSNEIDNVASNALTIGRLLPDNFTEADIFKAAGLNAKKTSKLLDEFSEMADLSQLPEAKKIEMISNLNEHTRLKDLYRVLRKGESGLIEKQRQVNKNKTISITDQMAGAAAFVTGGIDLALATTFVSNVVRRKGELSLGVGTKAIADKILGLEVSAGSAISGLKHIADTGTLAPFIFSDLVDPESPLNKNGFALIKNPQQVAEYKQNVSDDDSISTVQRAKIINEINRTGVLKIFKKGDPKGDAVEGGGFRDFRKKLEQFTPRIEQEPGEPEVFDFGDSPLFQKKKVTEPVPSGRPTGNLPMNKQIEGFLDTIMGTTQIGIDPQETFPESQISEDELAQMQSAASLPTPGKLLKINFGKGKGRGLDGSDLGKTKNLSQDKLNSLGKELDSLQKKLGDNPLNTEARTRFEDIKAILKGHKSVATDQGLSESAENALKSISKDAAIDSQELFQIKTAINRSSLNPETKEAIARLNSKGVKGDPYQGRDIGSVAWNPNAENLKKFDMPIPVYKADLRDGTLGHKVSQGGADPFMWMDHKWKVTQKFLKKHGDRIKTINTRSDLIAQDDYMEMLPKGATINMYVGPSNLREIASKTIEPGNPSLKRRLAAAEKLQKAGFKVNVVVDFFKGKNQKLINFLNDPEESNLKKRLFSVKENTVELTDEMEKSLEKILGDFK